MNKRYFKRDYFSLDIPEDRRIGNDKAFSDKVVLIDNEGEVRVGAPYVEGAVVKATVVDDSAKADKVLVFKKIRRKGFQKLNGHRQKLTKIRINEIA